MDCREAKEHLYDFSTGRLSKEDSWMVEDHVKECKNCQADLEDLKKTLSLLDEWKPPEISPDFKDRVMRRIEERFPETSMLQRIIEKFFQPLPLGGLAVAVIALFTFTFYFRGLRPEGEKPEIATKGLELPTKVAEAKRPIVIETKDVEVAFAQLEVVKFLVEIVLSDSCLNSSRCRL